jgi:glycosyltransferase involved in cell wall biosynthesis
VENLIAAFEKICRRHRNVNLVLTGRGSHDRMEAVLEKIAGLEFRDRILYKGYLDGEDFRRELQAADILCVTRTGSAFARTGFPFKLGEYLATGRPVAASNVGGVSEYLVDRRNAVLVEPDDIESIAEGIDWLIEHPEEARAIGLAGKAVAATHFDWRVVGERLKQVLLEL